MAVASHTLPPTPAAPPQPPRWRLVLTRTALALGVATLLWLAQRLAAAPRGVDVQRAEMATLPVGVESPTLPALAALDWQPIDAARLASWTGPYALRYRFAVSPGDTREPHAISISLRAAFTASWDGVSLPPNGRVGAGSADEVPGRVDWMAPVPTALGGPGLHELLIVASSHRQGARFRTADVRVSVAPLSALATATMRAWLLPLLALGALADALWYVFIVIARGSTMREARGLLSLGGAAFALTVAEVWRPLLGYPYPLHALRLRLVLLCTGLTMYCLVRYVHQRVGGDQHVVSQRLVWLLPPGLLVIAAAIPTYDMAAWLMHLVGMSLALFVIMRRREAQRRLGMVATVLATALVAIVASPWAYLDGAYLIAVAALLLVALFEHATFLRERAARTQALESDRLRLTAALVHRSIQPHWLMNTLTGLQELIEHDPPRASRVVELLAKEFRTVSEVSQRPWIGGEEELALCRTHLAIVSDVLLTPRRLDVTGEALLASIALPPGVVHALLENALTHAGTVAPTDIRDLSLSCAIDENDVVLHFDAPLGRGGNSGRRGTGTTFVDTSLEAAFPGRWQHTHGAVNGRWHVTIRFPADAARTARAHLERAA